MIRRYNGGMPLHSAGLLLYRIRDEQPELFLAHPGGPFWEKKDDGVWTIPKGLIDPDEDPLTAARREFQEETGHAVDGNFFHLGELKQKGNKIVHAWAVAGDLDADDIISNTFTAEWPPNSGRFQQFPEMDRAGWFGVAEARRKILPGQEPFIDRLLALLDSSYNAATAG